MSSISNSIWIFSPAIDFFALCGGSLWLLAMISSWLSQSFPVGHASSQGMILLLGSVLLSDPHFGAPINQAWSLGHRKAICASLIAVVLGIFTVLVLPAVGPAWAANILPCLAQSYLFIITIHFTMQNAAIAKLYLKRANFELDNIAIYCMQACFVVNAVHAYLLQIENPQAIQSTFLGMTLPSLPTIPPDLTTALFWLICITGSIFVIGLIVNALSDDKKRVPLPALLVIATNMIMFNLTDKTSMDTWIFVPAFLHGLQTIALHLFQRKKDLRQRKINTPEFVCNSLLIGCSVTFVVPAFMSVFAHNWTEAYAATIIIFSFHHFGLEFLQTRRIVNSGT